MTDGITEALQYAVTLHRAGDYTEAEHQYRRVLSLCRDCPSGINDERTKASVYANYYLGVLAVQVDQPALGISHLKSALDSDPSRAEFWTSYVVALLKVGRSREAMAALEEAKKRDIADPELDQMMSIAMLRAEVTSTYAADILEMLGPYAPNSAGSKESRAELALGGVNRLPILLSQLATGEQSAIGPNIQLIDNLCTDGTSHGAADCLRELFMRHGSDKSNVHNYHILYGHILQDPGSITSMLEIGLGTNNKDVVSNMSKSGRPGASLRAFRDFLPSAKIYGADVDKRVLFTEERIETFYVDQTDQFTFEDLTRRLPDELDLIIDDGLHSPDANLTSLIFALKKVRRGGWIIVEDIPPAALPVWKVVSKIVPSNYASRILRGRSAYVFAVQRLHEGVGTSLSQD